MQFLENLISHPRFLAGDYTTRFIDETPELFELPERRDRATKILSYIADVIVNGNPEVKGRARPARLRAPRAPDVRGIVPMPGLKQILDAKGPEAISQWMKEQERLLITDTTFRDAHQSLLATRVRTHDIVAVAPAYSVMLPELFSVECWGGATFDVAMRFLKECPWDRLRRLREAVPNHLLQMLLRSANAVGYSNYPDNVVEYFVEQAAENGIDLFRVFDSLNWVENMKMAMNAVLKTGRILEAAICFTGDFLDPDRSKYDLDYYLRIARALEREGAHVLAIKDMAGLLKPEAARLLVKALKSEIKLPIHLHTHDTSGISAATILAAAEAGVDAVDAAIDSMSGLTSQPPMGSIVAALARTNRATLLNSNALSTISDYWARVRSLYQAFESDIRSGTADVYVHEMPGGQYTNLREQARSLGIEDRWHEVSETYATVNRLFGDIVKVTPSSKVVGDMALMMVTNSLSAEDVLDPEKQIAFPQSVVALFRGDIGQPEGGFPPELQRKILKGEKPIMVRPGALMEPADLQAERKSAEEKAGHAISECELASYLMYPEVFVDFARVQVDHDDLSVLPTDIFFYGMQPQEEFAIEIEKGKTLLLTYSALSEPDDEGMVTVYFELNGQPRPTRVQDRSRAPRKASRPKAEPGNPAHLASPMPGLVVSIAVRQGDTVARGDLVLHIEAMKMQTAVLSERSGVVQQIAVGVGSQVDAKDLLMVID